MTDINWFSALPAELLQTLGDFLAYADLAAVTLVNKSLNEIYIPTLYANISLSHHPSARRCIRTLSADPATLARGRDLAPYVRSFMVAYISYQVSPSNKAKSARRLARALRRMSGSTYCTPDIYAALGSGSPAATLRSLNIELHPPSWTKGCDYPAAVCAALRPIFPELTSITIDARDGVPQEWLTVFSHLFTSRAEHLRAVSFENWNPSIMGSALCDVGVWTSLQELTVELYGPGLERLPPAPNIRTLNLIWMPAKEQELQKVVIPPDAFPHLEVLACPSNVLSAFLPANAQTPRPIRSVRLDGASYDKPQKSLNARQIQTRWQDLRAVLPCLSRSACTVTELEFAMDNIYGQDMDVEELAEFAGSFERLVIMLWTSPSQEVVAALGKTLFARTPKLHTFLLSDAPYRYLGWCFYLSRWRELQRSWITSWDLDGTVLRKIAFSQAVDDVWTRTRVEWEAPVLEQDAQDDEAEDDRGMSSESEGSESAPLSEDEETDQNDQDW
ncbi:hypothetical protein C2E23DRAFT_856748 [Lenzites betulinus]|nr:hypothetical protein C2E23DRAFT_856748 [Lenzites betulinus]